MPPLSMAESVACSLTLHACRRLLPTLGSQLMMSLESRRVMGHWAPNSAEPLRYDSSRCVSELAYKAQVAQRVAAGWRPGADFEVSADCPLQAPAPSASVAQCERSPMASPVDPIAASHGWMANASAPVRGKRRCLHVLTAPGVTACGWYFGCKSATGKEFFSSKPTTESFALCGACTASKSQRSLLADADLMPVVPSRPARSKCVRTKESSPSSASSSSRVSSSTGASG